jgi:hypothetical protein
MAAYSDEDIDAAVDAGVLSAETAAAFRAHAGQSRGLPAVDEEHFRLVSSFNDIFVAIAGLLVLVAAGWLLEGVGVAVTAWLLAEFFTLKRRMALPSILFLLAFCGGVFLALLPSEGFRGMLQDDASTRVGLQIAFAGTVTAALAWLHWWRFRVPITVAAGVAALIGMVAGLIFAAAPDLLRWMNGIMFVFGIAVFAYAMHWDFGDPLRRTRRSDVAFWLHLLAAPLIVHPVFTLLGGPGRDIAIGGAVAVMLLYAAMAVVALVIDRRALMVSALAYVLAAISSVLEQFGAVGINVALTALLIGSALLMLSAFWHAARSRLVCCLPGGWQRRLPPLR